MCLLTKQSGLILDRWLPTMRFAVETKFVVVAVVMVVVVAVVVAVEFVPINCLHSVCSNSNDDH